MAVYISPTSSAWEDLCGAAIAYGLTDGGSKATGIALTDLGRRMVAPTEEGQDVSARVDAALKPSIAGRFFDRYNRAKFPQERIAKNVLAEMGVPVDRLDKVLQILTRNGEFVGIIHQTKTGPFVATDTPAQRSVGLTASDLSLDNAQGDPGAPTHAPAVTETAGMPIQKREANQRVFITHGKNKQVVAQLKELLAFGKFDPVVAQEHETTSKPVPDKVLDDMHTCFAGIIHVAGEEELFDGSGSVHHKIDENVLIEIGAAMALYGRNLYFSFRKASIFRPICRGCMCVTTKEST